MFLASQRITRGGGIVFRRGATTADCGVLVRMRLERCSSEVHVCLFGSSFSILFLPQFLCSGLAFSVARHVRKLVCQNAVLYHNDKSDKNDKSGDKKCDNVTTKMSKTQYVSRTLDIV